MKDVKVVVGGEEHVLTVVDTPGLGDSGGAATDTQHILNMVKALKELGSVDAILVLFNSQDPRFSCKAQATS